MPIFDSNIFDPVIFDTTGVWPPIPPPAEVGGGVKRQRHQRQGKKIQALYELKDWLVKLGQD